MDDAGDGTRWMTYGELATARAITKASATRLAFRKGWPRRTGNDGQARVAVPQAAQTPSPDNIHGVVDDDTHGAMDDALPGIMDADTLFRERQRADQAEVRADRAEASQAEAYARADRAEAQAAAARDQAEQRGAALTAALVAAAVAEGEARGLRAALEEARRPTWWRWLGKH